MTAVRQRSKEKPTFRRVVLSRVDLAALKFVTAAYGLPSFIEAVRMCLRQQALRDKAMGCDRRGPVDPEAAGRLLVGGLPDAAKYKEIVDGLLTRVPASTTTKHKRVSEGTVVSVPAHVTVKHGEKLRGRLWRFWKDDEKAVAAIQKGWGFLDMVAAARFALRVQAILAGFPRDASDGW